MLLNIAAVSGIGVGFRVSGVSGTRHTFSNVNCVNSYPLVQLTVEDGVEPYSFSWSKVSGDGTIFSQSSTNGNLEVEFLSVCPQETKSGVYRVTVTDSAGSPETITKDVTVSTTNTF